MTFATVLSLVSCLLIPSRPGNAADQPRKHELELRSTTVTSSEPLRTEDFATLDPGVTNPHLERWALGRAVELRGLAPRILPQGAFGVTASALDARSSIHLRAEGPWYQNLKRFPCGERTPTPDFATREGTRAVADGAARAWDDLLADENPRLSMALAHVAAPTVETALAQGQRAFKEWLARMDADWREEVAGDLLPEQWKQYRDDARAAGICPSQPQAPNASSESLYDALASAEENPVPARPSGVPASGIPAAAVDLLARPQPLFRSPAHRREGYFTIHLDFGVGIRSISGAFLIDPSSPQSVVSPDWLSAQGVHPAWVEIPGAPATHVRVRAGDGATGLARMASFDSVVTSGFPLSVRRFQVFDVSEIFDEPDSPAPCCSGILGQDFLSRYVLEFRPGEPTEVVAWPISGPRWTDERFWVEMHRVQAPGQPAGVMNFVVNCSPRVKALNLPRLCQNPDEALRNAVGPLVFDVPHGKLWYSKKDATAPILSNRSGLKLGFGYVKHDRALIVEAIGKTPGAESLRKEGLRKGDVILSVDDIPATQLDVWEVDRRLAGAYGDEVTLKWSTRGEYKVAPLPVIIHETLGDRNRSGGEAR